MCNILYLTNDSKMKTRLKLLTAMLAMLNIIQVAHATELKARVKNYDHWKDLPSETLLDQGNEYCVVDKVDSALVCFIILSNRYSEKQPENEKKISCRAMTGVASIYMRYYDDYQTAYRYLLRAEQIAKQNHFENQLAGIYKSIAILQSDRLDIENNFSYQPQSLDQHKKVFYQAVKSHNNINICLSFLNLSIIAIKFDMVDNIRNEIKVSHTLEIPDSIRLKPLFQGVLEGVTAYEANNLQEAWYIFSRLDNLLPQQESPLEIAGDKFNNCIFRYAILMSLKRDTSAFDELNEAERIARDNQLNISIVEILRMKQEYFATHGNTALAQEYELKYYKAKDEFINRTQLLSVEQQKFLFELEEIGKEVKDLENQKHIREIVLSGIVLLSLLITGALIFLWRNYQNTKKRNLLLFKKNQELLALESQEKERKTLAQAETKKYKSSPMDDSAKDDLLQQLQDIMENRKEIFEEGFTLDQLARLAEVNPNYVSQVINEKKGCNFNAFVNEYRIKEACRRLSDKENFGGLTIEAIGQSVGFKSRANFAATFKKFTGMTPAAYHRLANTDKDLTDTINR